MKCATTGLAYWRIPAVIGRAFKELFPGRVIYQFIPNDGLSEHGYFVFEAALFDAALYLSNGVMAQAAQRELRAFVTDHTLANQQEP